MGSGGPPGSSFEDLFALGNRFSAICHVHLVMHRHSSIMFGCPAISDIVRAGRRARPTGGRAAGRVAQPLQQRVLAEETLAMLRIAGPVTAQDLLRHGEAIVTLGRPERICHPAQVDPLHQDVGPEGACDQRGGGHGPCSMPAGGADQTPVTVCVTLGRPDDTVAVRIGSVGWHSRHLPSMPVDRTGAPMHDLTTQATNAASAPPTSGRATGVTWKHATVLLTILPSILACVLILPLTGDLLPLPLIAIAMLVVGALITVAAGPLRRLELSWRGVTPDPADILVTRILGGALALGGGMVLHGV